MRIENSGHQEMSRGKLLHISRRASAISSSVMWMFRSAHKPRRLRRGFFGPPFFSFRKSTKSKTSFCFSGGKSRSFSTTCCSIVKAASRAISGYYKPARPRLGPPALPPKWYTRIHLSEVGAKSYRLKDRRKAGLVPPREQERAAAAHSLASASVAPKTRQKAALGSTTSEAKEAHS